MPQYLKLRFGGRRIRVWIAVIYQVVTIIAQIASQLFAGSVFIEQIFKWDLYASIILILGITCIFTVLGGLTAVIWTDTIQTAILVVGSFAVGGIALSRVGSFETVRQQFLTAGANYTFRDVALFGNRTCGFPPDDSFHIFRSADSDSYPWPGMVFGVTILALYVWCTEQTCVQRYLSAKNMTHAKAGVTLAAYLKVLSVLFFIIPGMISRVLYPSEVGCADPVECERICGNAAGCADIAYPLLVLRILPTGVRGVMMAALLSALISSLTSIFNSSSTVFTMDIYRLCRPRAKEAEKMIVGRLWILLLAIVGTAWLPILKVLRGSQFWSYFQSISSFLHPPIVMAFLFGMFWKRTTEKGVFSGLVVGLICGVIRMGLEWSRVAPTCGSDDADERFMIVAKIHYLHFAMILATITSIVIVVISLFTKPRSEAQLRRVTWWTRNTKELQEHSDNSDNEDNEEYRESESEKTHVTDNKSVTPSKTYVTDNTSVTPSKTHVTDNKSVTPSKSSDSSSSRSGKESKIKIYALKWFCGVDHTKEEQKLTREEALQRQIQATNIEQDPFWKKVVDINAIVCCMCCFFLHGFWF